MWKLRLVKRLTLFILVICTHTIEICLSASLDTSIDLFNQNLGHDIGTLEKEEPGFDFTDQEMIKLKIWPRGVIPYFIDTVSFDAEFRKKLDLYLESVSVTTGVQFLKLFEPPKGESTRWVFFVNRRGFLNTEGCTTKDFTNQGVQKVVVGYNSPYNGEMYEITLAILGIPPQHNAPNRDDFITVNMDNILPDKKHLFEKLKDDEWLFHDLDYDYYSAGHYGLHKYSIGGNATIVPKLDVLDGIGDGNGFTYTDTKKIRMMYNYISKTRSKRVRQSHCLKIFKPGPKFDSYKPDKQSLPDPRPKPNKYLGKSDDDTKKKPKLRLRTTTPRRPTMTTKISTRTKKRRRI